MFTSIFTPANTLPKLAVRGSVGASMVSGQAGFAGMRQHAVQGNLRNLPLSQWVDSDALCLGNDLPRAYGEFHPHIPLPGRSNVV